MRNREAGEYFPSSEELAREKAAQERHDEQRQKEFLLKRQAEEEKRLRPTEADKREAEKKEREQWLDENDPVRRALKRARQREEARLATPEGRAEQERLDLEARQKKEEEDKRWGIGLSGTEQAAWDKRQEAARLERGRKQQEQERFENKQAQQNYDRLREEKAPAEKVQELIDEKAGFRLDDNSTIDIRKAIPALAERLRDSGDSRNATDALEVSLKTLEVMARDALMFGGDHKASLDNFVADLQQKLFETARRNHIDLAALLPGAPQESAAEGKEARPSWSLDSALATRGKDEWFLRELMAVERSADEREKYNEQKRAIDAKIAAGAGPDDGELGAMIDRFVRDVQRGRDANGL